jgi:hypothetical protein
MLDENTVLGEAERILIKRAMSGELADFSDLPDKERTINAEVLRSLLLGLKLPPLHAIGPTPIKDWEPFGVRSIWASGPIITGKLDLVEAIGAEGGSLPPLVLSFARFEGSHDDKDVDAQHAWLARLSLRNCKFTRVVLRDAKVGGDVDLSGAEPIDRAKGCQILADGCQVEGSFRADGSELYLDRTKERSAITEAEIEYALNLTNAKIEGNISLMLLSNSGAGNGRIVPPYAGGGGKVAAPAIFRAEGVRLDLARVSGSVWLDGARLRRTNPDLQKEGYALHAHSCRISGSLFMSAIQIEAKKAEIFRASGCISFVGARIDGNLDCRGAQLRDRPEGEDGSPAADDRDWSYSLDARDATVGGDVLFRVSRCEEAEGHPQFRATNRVCLSGTKVGGELNCRGGAFERELDLSNADIGTNVYLGKKSDEVNPTYRFQSHEAVKLMNARIKGRFECTNAILKRRERSDGRQPGYALNASEFRVDGNLVFSPRLEGNATFERCRVEGDLDLSGLQLVISNTHAPSVTFSDSIIERRIAIGSKIKVADKDGKAPLLDRLRPVINLDGVEVGILADNGGLGWGQFVRLKLDGLTYKYLEQINDPQKKRRFRDYIAGFIRWLFGRFHLRISEHRETWLNLQYKRKRRRFMINRCLRGEYRYKINRRTYRAQPYEQLARVLDDQGWNEDSRHILVSKLWLDGMWVPWVIQPFHMLFGYLFGFGLAHRKAVVVLASYLIVGGLLFSYASKHHLLVVDQSPVTTSFADTKTVSNNLPDLKTGKPAVSQTPDGSLDTADIECGDTISPWIFALDAAIPFLHLREHQRCTIRTPTGKKAFKLSQYDTGVKIPLWDRSAKAWSPTEISIPLPAIDSVELFWRHLKATYTVLGWILSSIAILTLTGVLRKAAEQ